MLQRFIENREAWITQRAVEGAAAGIYPLKHGAKLARMQDTTRGNSSAEARTLQQFERRVKQMQELREAHIEEGAQRHTFKANSEDGQHAGDTSDVGKANRLTVTSKVRVTKLA
jgi:hypothetical protein